MARQHTDSPPRHTPIRDGGQVFPGSGQQVSRGISQRLYIATHVNIDDSLAAIQNSNEVQTLLAGCPRPTTEDPIASLKWGFMVEARLRLMFADALLVASTTTLPKKEAAPE